MDNAYNGNDNEKDKLSSVTFKRNNSLPAPCGIKTENLIRDQNRGSIGIIVTPTQLTKESNIKSRCNKNEGMYIHKERKC